MAREANTPKIICENTNLQLKRDVMNIVEHKGTNLTTIIRSFLIEYRDKHPVHMREPVKKY